MRIAAICCHAPAVAKIRSLARENAATRTSMGACGAGRAGRCGSRMATVRGGARCIDARASRAARQAPTGPPPTTTTSKSSATEARCHEAQTTRQARRGPAKARAHSRERAFRRRRKIKQQQPEVAQHADAAPSVAEELDESVGK